MLEVDEKCERGLVTVVGGGVLLLPSTRVLCVVGKYVSRLLRLVWVRSAESIAAFLSTNLVVGAAACLAIT